jgi:multiple sugar transport system permease protein
VTKRRGLVPLQMVGILVLFLIYILPLYSLVAASLSTNVQLVSEFSLVFTPTLDAYKRVINGALVQASTNSLIIATGTTTVTIAIAVPAAYGIARAPGLLVSLALGSLIILQMMPQTSAVIPLYQILGAWHLIGSLPGLILADAAQMLPFCILILRPFFRGIPLEVEEAAAVDGARRWRIFLRIALPLARNGIATAAALVFLIAWGEFLYAITLLFEPATYPISALLAQQHSNWGLDWPALMALATLSSLPILAIYLLAYRSLREGISLGAR